MNLIRKLKKIIYPIYSQYMRRVIITEGTLSNGDTSIKFLYLGDNGRRSYLDDFAYDTPSTTIINTSIRYSQLDSFIQKHKPDIALVYLPEKWDHLKNNYRHYQSLHYISQRIDVSGTWDEVKAQFGRSRRTFSNQVESKYGFSCRISHDMNDFDHFYHHMYLPYITTRFNEQYLNLDSYEDMKQYFLKGFLLFITHEGKDILASLTVEEGDSLSYRRVGILDGNKEYNNSKAQMAMYFYLITTAREKGFKYMNAMESIAFFNDGIYQSKWRWGSSIYKNDRTDIIPYFLILNNFEKSVNFFRNNPTIVKTDEGLYGLLGWENSAPITEQEIKSLRKSYYAKGLKGMILLRPSENETQQYIFQEN